MPRKKRKAVKDARGLSMQPSLAAEEEKYPMRGSVCPTAPSSAGGNAARLSLQFIIFGTAQEATAFREGVRVDPAVFTVQEPGMANVNADEVILASSAALDFGAFLALAHLTGTYHGELCANLVAGA